MLHFEALWVETSETPQGLPGVSAHGRGAWSRSLVAEQLVGGAEAVKREIQRERGRERERKKPHSAEARC